MLVSALVLAACGGSSSAPKSLTIPFKSPAVVGSILPARYTCDGQDVSPPLEWGAVPATTKELVFFILGLKPNPATGRYKFTVEWALAGVKPALHKLSAGEVPKGAHVGTATDGKRRYSVCPAKHTSEQFQFAVYAVPASTSILPRFSGPRILGLIAGSESQTRSEAGGSFVAAYKRG
jgi:hypothetical protein